MKKLKRKLLYSLFVVVCIIYVGYIVSYEKYNSCYDINTTFIRGKILSYEINGDRLELEIKGREKIIIFYQLKSLEEKELYKNLLFLGDIYEFTGIFEIPSTHTNFNLFSYKNYLLSKKIYYVMQANSINLYEKSHSILYTIKNKLYRLIKNRETGPYLSLFLLGDNNLIHSDILQMYRNCGISHLIAISGMHISLISMILLYLLRWLPSKYIQYGMVIVTLWIYAFLIGFTPSVTRAVTSFTILSILHLQNRKINPLYITLLIGILFLLYNPFYIYHTGFLFSFIISFFLLLSKNILSMYKNYIVKIFLISLISFLASIPIVATTFYETNLLSLFLNGIFVPLVSFVVFPCALIIFFIPCSDFIFLLITNILELVVQFCNKYLIINLIIPHMNFYMIVIYYIILFIVLYNRKIKWSIFFFIFLVIYSYQNIFQKYFVITIIDVGQGDSIFIELPHNQGNILIDTGGKINYVKEDWKIKEESSITERIITPYLKSIGIRDIDYLILSHGDYDHMGEAINLINNFKVNKVVFNCGEYNDLEKELINVLENKNIKYYSCIKELNINQYKLQFLNTKGYDNENDNSNVIYFNYSNYKFLFMGDAGVDREKDILNEYNLGNMDFLKVGHHGSDTSSSQEFIDSINPKYSLISVGKNNRYGHPKESIIDALSNSKIYRTDLDGSIEIKLTKNGLNFRICSS